ncbi:hypothetical protein HELRODRAFT_148585, partial [Helobdella robusta]|uniref:Homeobox domain-containing protein n=1 Tax=Helobdella robusta TaxID=6412 RepID=T1EKA6_HELRO
KDHHRTAHSPGQIEKLENEFVKNNFLDASRRDRISAETGLDINQVRYWFQYRRVKERKLK